MSSTSSRSCWAHRVIASKRPVGNPLSVLSGACFFKGVHELAIPPCNMTDGGFARGSFRPPCCDGFPKVGAPDGEADEARHSSRNFQPFARLLGLPSAVQNDAADFVTTSVTGGRHDAFVILPAIETFHAPDVGFDVGIL